MTKTEAAGQIAALLAIICPAYNAFQAKDQQGQIDEILAIFAASAPERQAELLGLLGTSFYAFYSELTQEERKTLCEHFGITVNPAFYATEQECINAVLAGKPALYSYSFETEAIFYFIAMAYTNSLQDLQHIDQTLFDIFIESHLADGTGMNVWSNFVGYCLALQPPADLLNLCISFTPKFR